MSLFGMLPKLRAEHEIEVYDRDFLEPQWDRHVTDAEDTSLPPMIALPFTTFIDAFGLFRSSQRSLVGWYMTLAGLSTDERHLRAHTLPILLSPHGSVFEEAVNQLRCFIPLDKGVGIGFINGRHLRMSVFTLAYVGDMPQQNQNSGCLGPSATRYCRLFFTSQHAAAAAEAFSSANPEVILADNPKQGRFSHDIVDIRLYATEQLSERQRAAYNSQ